MYCCGRIQKSRGTTKTVKCIVTKLTALQITLLFLTFRYACTNALYWKTFQVSVLHLHYIYIKQRYRAGLRAGWSGVRVPAGARNFSFHHRVQTGSGAHPAYYAMDTRGSFPGVKLPGREAAHSPPSSAEVKSAWSYTFTPPYIFMARCLIKREIRLHEVVLS
jgi:hypothetical protein